MKKTTYLAISLALALGICLDSKASELVTIKISFGIVEINGDKIEIYINGVCNSAKGNDVFNISPRVKFDFPKKTTYLENADELMACLGDIEKGKLDKEWSIHGAFSTRFLHDVYELKRESGGDTWTLKLSRMEASLLKNKIELMMTAHREFKVELDRP
jgi:hypothetical protein